MNLLILTETYPPDRGGMAQSCDRIVRSLRGRGVGVDLAHFSRRHRSWKTELRNGGRDLICPVEEDRAHTINRLWNVIQDPQMAVSPQRLAPEDSTDRLQRPWDAVLAFGGMLPMLAAPPFAAWLELPLVVMIRGNDFDAGLFSLRRGDILRDALGRADLICTVTLDQKRRIQALFPQASIRHTPNGIDTTEWTLDEADRVMGREWRDRNVPPGRRLLGMFGHLKQKKGGLFFLETLLRSGRSDRFHVLLIGDAETAMMEWLEANGASLSFTHLPFMDRWELLPYYAATDLAVIPSFYDGLPNVLLEAGALGIPLLASTAGGMADVLTEGEAFLFHPGNPQECRRAIQQATECSTEQLESMGQSLRRVVTSRYDGDREMDHYIDLLTSLVADRSRVETFQ